LIAVRALALGAVVAALALVAAGCASSSASTGAKASAVDPTHACAGAKLRGWQRLANRIHADVYCPGWLPDPLDGVIGSQWNNIAEVSPDRSYLESWVWQETGPGAAGGELHVNLRGYPGRTAIPRCDNSTRVNGKLIHSTLPCFAQPTGTVRANGIVATVYTVNQGADQWHVAYGWHHAGSLYTISEHVAPPLTYRKVLAYLNRMLQSLVLVHPSNP
jgi:hypothetical protein